MEKFIFHGIVQKDEDNYIAVCYEWDVASEGNSLEEARENLKSAVENYLELKHKANNGDEVILKSEPDEPADKFFGRLKVLLHSESCGFREIVYV